MDAELDNIRTALTWGLSRDPDHALELADAAFSYWYSRGLFREGLQSLEDALSAASAGEPIVRARAVNAAGWLALNLDEYEHARLRMDEAYGLARATGDSGVMAYMLATRVFLVVWVDGDLEEGRRLAEESIAIARESGDRWLLGECLNNAVVPAQASDPAAALELLDESLELFRAVGDRDRVASELHNIAWVCLTFDLPRAERSAAEALAIGREHGSNRVAAGSSIFLGFAVALQGDPARAESDFVEGLRLAREVGSQRLMIEAIEGLAGVAAAAGDDERAARLWASGDQALDALHIPHLPPEDEVRGRWFQLKHADGPPMELGEAVDYALTGSPT
jgi:tetratricopeptide (TPR) repeat protein